MRIINERADSTKYFRDIINGDCFLDKNNNLYMKIDLPKHAVSLSCGNCFVFEDDNKVTLVETEIYIY